MTQSLRSALFAAFMACIGCGPAAAQLASVQTSVEGSAQTIERLLDEGEAALAAARVDAAAALLESLQRVVDGAGGGVAADLLARVHLLRGRLASERDENNSAADAFAAARALLEAAGLTQTRHFVTVLVGQADIWRDLRGPGELEKGSRCAGAGHRAAASAWPGDEHRHE